MRIGQTVGDLLENAGLRSIGHGGINFQAAHDRAGMQNQSVRSREPQARGSELIACDVFLGRERRLVNALRLDAQNHDDVRAIERFVNPVGDAQVRGELFEFATDPHRRAAKRDPRRRTC